jgi:asparagine N-glycosylation enzyme membrane subunit Stt3
LWTLRAVITVHALAVLAQPVLAGLFLTGDVDAIGVHGLIGSLLTLVGMAVIGVALAYVLGGRGRLWVLPVAVLLFLADGFQIAAGYERQLELHIPLGVAIVVVSVLLAAWAWSPSAARPRSRR